MIINKEKDVQYVLANLDIAHIRELSINKLHKYYHTAADNHLKAKRFDYYLPKLRTVIEFDGSQHFAPIDYFGGMDQFMSTVTTDFEKMNYCFDNNIKVIRLTQGTNSDFLAQAINDHEHNLITIKDNQLESQSIDRFDLPESFNVHIENQTLKSKINELQDELESIKNPPSVQESINALLAENDQVGAYVEFLAEQEITKLPYICATNEYNRFINWLKEINPSANPIKIIKFTKDFESHMRELGFTKEKTRMRPSELQLINYNNDVVNTLTGYPVESKRFNKSTFLVNTSNKIDTTKRELDINDPCDLQLYYHLVQVEGDITIAEKYGHLVD